MKRIVWIALLGTLLYNCTASKELASADKTPVMAVIDLNNVNDDKVLVEIDPGAFTKDTVSFFIPKTVPGTYSINNYGKYIEGFKALDYKGNELTVSKVDDNTWKIGNGKNLDKVNYLVNDTYDIEKEVDDVVFSPAGTNILKGEDFMLNLHGFIGYFGGLKEVSYEITIKKPAGLQSTTSLTRKMGGVDPNTEVFLANRYFDVIDNPILYAKPNTASFKLNDITVTLSVYSPTGTYTAQDLIGPMEKMMRAQKAFLGEVNGTKQYNILLYLSTMDENDAGGFGALEHHTSTVVVLPEAMPEDRLEQAMVDVVSHEFFHTLTPLNVHSREIQFFDFNDPKMSQHLWMYEGTTEYFANLFQVQQGLIDEAEFYNRIVGKINNSKSFDDSLSFTEMSKNVLNEPYKKNYPNVYEKGALISMALDITLRELSDGKKVILWLMKELSKKYDDTTPFEDDKLIDEIVAMTYPEVRTFFDTYVIGNTPIDYNVYLAKVGLTMGQSLKQTGYFLDGDIPFIDIDMAGDKSIFVRKGIELNSFFKDLGVQGGDIIKSINGIPITLETMRPIIGASFGWTPETDIKMVVERDGKEIEIAGTVGTPTLNVETIQPIEGASERQIQLRNAWLKG
ncbi:MAG: peptidase M61 [Maribacter sp.]|nr:peptidase M61 [Maribacter sp.]